jgi:hypothetical protein
MVPLREVLRQLFLGLLLLAGIAGCLAGIGMMVKARAEYNLAEDGTCTIVDRRTITCDSNHCSSCYLVNITGEICGENVYTDFVPDNVCASRETDEEWKHGRTVNCIYLHSLCLITEHQNLLQLLFLRPSLLLIVSIVVITFIFVYAVHRYRNSDEERPLLGSQRVVELSRAA